MRYPLAWVLAIALLSVPSIGVASASSNEVTTDCYIDLSRPTEPRWSSDCFTINKPRPRPHACMAAEEQGIFAGCGSTNTTLVVDAEIVIPSPASTPAGDAGPCEDTEDPCRLAFETELTVNLTDERNRELVIPSMVAFDER